MAFRKRSLLLALLTGSVLSPLSPPAAPVPQPPQPPQPIGPARLQATGPRQRHADPRPRCRLDYTIGAVDPGSCFTGTYVPDDCLEIQTGCAGAQVSATVKAIHPLDVSNARGVLLLLSGGSGKFWLEGGFASLFIDHMLAKGYYVIQVRWNGTWGWFDHGDDGQQHDLFTVSCNVYNVFEAVRSLYFDPLTNPDKKFLACGISAGTAQISLATLWCGFDAIDGAIFIGGASNYRLDHGCLMGTDGSTAPGALGPHLLEGGHPVVTIPRVVMGPSGPVLDGTSCAFFNTTPRGNRGPLEQEDADLLMTATAGTKLFDRAFGDIQQTSEVGRCSLGATTRGASLYERGSIAKLLETESYGYPIYNGEGESDRFAQPYQAYLQQIDPNFNGGNGFAALECIDQAPHNIFESVLGAMWMVDKFDLLDALP